MSTALSIDTESTSGIRRLAQLCLLKEAERGSQYLMAIDFSRHNIRLPHNGYFDETEKENVIGVAGWLGTFENWISFERRWLEALPREANGDFHYTDFWARKSYGADWSDEKRIEHVRTLATIARDCTEYAVGAVISRTVYEQEMPSADRQAFKSPLHYCLALCVTGIIDVQQTLKPPLLTPVRFMFDRKRGQEGTLAEIYYTVRELFDQDEILGNMSFGSRRGEPPLQAADLLIGELRRKNAGKASVIMDILSEKRSLLFMTPQDRDLRAHLKKVRANMKGS